MNSAENGAFKGAASFPAPDGSSAHDEGEGNASAEVEGDESETHVMKRMHMRLEVPVSAGERIVLLDKEFKNTGETVAVSRIVEEALKSTFKPDIYARFENINPVEGVCQIVRLRFPPTDVPRPTLQGGSGTREYIFEAPVLNDRSEAWVLCACVWNSEVSGKLLVIQKGLEPVDFRVGPDEIHYRRLPSISSTIDIVQGDRQESGKNFACTALPAAKISAGVATFSGRLRFTNQDCPNKPPGFRFIVIERDPHGELRAMRSDVFASKATSKLTPKLKKDALDPQLGSPVFYDAVCKARGSSSASQASPDGSSVSENSPPGLPPPPPPPPPPVVAPEAAAAGVPPVCPARLSQLGSEAPSVAPPRACTWEPGALLAVGHGVCILRSVRFGSLAPEAAWEQACARPVARPWPWQCLALIMTGSQLVPFLAMAALPPLAAPPLLQHGGALFDCVPPNNSAAGTREASGLRPENSFLDLDDFDVDV
eukprot:tig00020909_g15374.t1